MRDDKSNIQRMAAELYISKRGRAAREIAARAGTPYEHESVSDRRAYELYWQRDPDVDEQRAWIEAAAAVQAGKLEPNRLASYVVEKVYPARIAVTEGGGRTDLKAQAAFARRMVERKNRETGTGESQEPSASEAAPDDKQGQAAPEGMY